MSFLWRAEPVAGEVVWCHFPNDPHPCAEPRLALILAVFVDGRLYLQSAPRTAQASAPGRCTAASSASSVIATQRLQVGQPDPCGSSLLRRLGIQGRLNQLPACTVEVPTPRQDLLHGPTRQGRCPIPWLRRRGPAEADHVVVLSPLLYPSQRRGVAAHASGLACRTKR